MREIRKKSRAIGIHEAENLLARCEYGVLSTTDNNGQPYCTPLNYVYKNNCIYFHCAHAGHKIDNIESNPKVSFCAVGATNVIPSEFRTDYESVVAFGIASEAEGAERHKALVFLLEKYSPEFVAEGKIYIDQMDGVTKVIKIEINHISGKIAQAKLNE